MLDSSRPAGLLAPPPLSPPEAELISDLAPCQDTVTEPPNS
jgi:hypothetical protein